TTAVVVIEPREPAEAERRARLVHPVVVTERDDVVARGVTLVALPRQRCHSVRAQKTRACGRLVVAAYDHPTLADGEILVREEAVGAREPERARVLVPDPRAERMRAVLEQ